MSAVLKARTLDGDLKLEFVCAGERALIGRDPACDIVIPRPTVSKSHALLVRTKDGEYTIRNAESTTGVFVNGTCIEREECLLKDRDKVILGDVVLLFQQSPEAFSSGSQRVAVPGIAPGALPLDGNAARTPFLHGFKRAPDKDSSDPYVRLRASIHDVLIQRIRSTSKNDESMADEELWHRAELTANQIIHEKASRKELPPGISPKTLLKDILDEALGLGPIQDLLDDPEIEEIMVNGPNHIFVARHGVNVETGRKFVDEERLLTVINRIVAPLGRPLSQSTPMVDARLADGSRVNAIIPPVSLVGPVLTIRKFPQSPFQPSDLIDKGTINRAIAEFFRLAILHRQNILIAGGTGTGKTTLLNAVSSYIPSNERIVTIEDSAELQLLQPHVISLETRPRSLEGTAEITIRDLVRNSLRMRPDRIIIGECRGGEAIDMLQAMNTGHDGSLTTGHANGCSDMLSRLETMCLTAGLELPLAAVREQISRAIDLIVHITRMPDGSRRVASVAEVVGLSGANYDIREIYRYDYKVQEGGRVEGRFVPMGYVPQFVEVLSMRGESIPMEIFEPA